MSSYRSSGTPRMNQPADFGRYLQSVAERYIDLLLMEEFHVEPTFTDWFAVQVGLTGAAFDGAWHSVNDQDGETDLLLRVEISGERVAILIENKIGAPAQPDQDIRYHLRGARAQEAGRYDRFITAICAPQIYLDAMPENTAYQHRIAYEALQDWFAQIGGRRASWRCAIMKEAIEQGRRGYTMTAYVGLTAFHMAYWSTVEEQFSDLVMKRPTMKGSHSSWVVMRGADFPKGVTLNHKLTMGVVDLSFSSTEASSLSAMRTENWPKAARVLRTGKSAALRLAVPICDLNAPFDEQADRVHVALEAARKLAPYAQMLAADR